MSSKSVLSKSNSEILKTVMWLVGIRAALKRFGTVALVEMGVAKDKELHSIFALVVVGLLFLCAL